jgi:hypothetical protein
MGRFSVDPSDLGLPLDSRGFLPLDAARARVRAATVFERGESHYLGPGQLAPTDADFLWISLLSLEDADEFVQEASRLEWKFPTRGANVDPVLRFGAGVLPWLASRLAEDGTLPSELPMIDCSLGALGPEAIRVVVRAKRRFDADADRLGFLDEWLRRHGDPAWAALAKEAVAGDAASRAAVLALARRSPRTAKKKLSAAIGKAQAEELLRGAGELEASTILRVLDAAAAADTDERVRWPTLRASAGHFEYHAMRVVAVRAAKGDDWGILIEVAQGDLLDRKTRWPAVVQRYTYGSRVAPGGRYLTDSRPLAVKASRGMLREPVEISLDRALAERLDLRPGCSITQMVEDWPSVLAIRAALALARAAIFPDPATLLGPLKITKPVIVAVSDAFAHVDGPALGVGPLAALPSTSLAYRTMAEAIVHRDPSRFDPGVPNTDWRLHADREQPFAWP